MPYTVLLRMCYVFNFCLCLHLKLELITIIFSFDVCIIVPTPAVSVTAPNTQIVGQSLTLQCEVTTVRGITSSVDIVWSSGGTVLRRMNGVSLTTMDSSLVYTESYTLSTLSEVNNGNMIQCEVVINTSPSVIATDSITLDVTGEYDTVKVAYIIILHSAILCVVYVGECQKLILVR